METVLEECMNEDGVPMNEKDIEHIWLDYANKSGFYTAHIENIGTSMPDAMLIWKGVVLFHEAKIQRGNLIYFQQYQLSAFFKMRHSCHPWQLNVVVWKNGVFSLYSIDQIKTLPIESAGRGKVKVNISTLVPLITVSNDFEFELYVEWLRGKIWKKKT